MTDISFSTLLRLLRVIRQIDNWNNLAASGYTCRDKAPYSSFCDSFGRTVTVFSVAVNSLWRIPD